MRTSGSCSTLQGVADAFGDVRPMPQLVNQHTDPSTDPLPSDEPPRFEVRSVTGACYTLIEERAPDQGDGVVRSRYRTAYAGLPVVANEDGSFTIVDTRTRLVRVALR
jgi:hypothetical protein